MLLVIASCSNNQYHQQLAEIDSVSNSLPDSAKKMLVKIQKEMNDASKSDRMYYNLLSIKIKDKSYDRHTSDSLILKVVDYYESFYDKNLLPEAYYYAGNVYADLNDEPQALEYYLKAKDQLERCHNLRLEGFVTNAMGYVYVHQMLYDNALECFRASYVCDSIRKDTLGMCYSLRDMAEVDNDLGNYERALEVLSLGERLSRKAKLMGINSSILGYTALTYNRLGDYSKALEMLHKSFSHLQEKDQSGRFSTAAKIFLNINELDSAKFYLEKSISKGTVYAKQSAYRGLMNIAYKNKNDKELYKIASLYNKYTDSLLIVKNMEQTSLIKARYDYNIRQKQIEQFKEEKSIFASLLFVSINLILIIILWIFIRSIIEKYKIQDIENECNRSLIVSKDSENVQYKQANTEKHEVVESKTKISDKLDHFRKNGELTSAITPEEWKELDVIVNTQYEGFAEQLFNKYKLSDLEYHVCLLLKLDFSPTEIASLIFLTKQSIANMRRRLYFKLFNKEGSPSEFDNFIRCL